MPCLTIGLCVTQPGLFLFVGGSYTEDAGLAFTAGIPMKFRSAHGRLRPEVGSGFLIDGCARKWVPPSSRIFGTSDKEINPPTALLRPIQNLFSLTVCS